MSIVCTAKIKLPNGQIVLAAAVLMLRASLKMEILTTMGRRGQSAYSQTKALFLLKGSKQRVYDQLDKWIVDNIKTV
jgi:hypothetical protein